MKHAYIVQIQDDSTDFQATADLIYETISNNTDLQVLDVKPFAAKGKNRGITPLTSILAVKPALPGGNVQ